MRCIIVTVIIASSSSSVIVHHASCIIMPSSCIIIVHIPFIIGRHPSFVIISHPLSLSVIIHYSHLSCIHQSSIIHSSVIRHFISHVDSHSSLHQPLVTVIHQSISPSLFIITIPSRSRDSHSLVAVFMTIASSTIRP